MIALNMNALVVLGLELVSRKRIARLLVALDRCWVNRSPRAYDAQC